MFIWIMLILAAIWVGLAIWGYLDTQKPKQKKVEIKKTEKVDKGKERLEQVRKETNDYLREQGYKSTVHVSSGAPKTFTSTSTPTKKYESTSVAARKQTSTSTPSRSTSRDRNDDDYNPGWTFGALSSTYTDDDSSRSSSSSSNSCSSHSSHSSSWSDHSSSSSSSSSYSDHSSSSSSYSSSDSGSSSSFCD
ncbi:hypothetical protein BCP78_0068 [Bacillus phage BCP78]|uniref:Uncharacterized protein n=3 Tax=Tsarbombavirus BCP78 TaxID=1985182 RepID=J9PRK8_9CAUD|nr:hypothetical protein BCP78_0068 [Bacillus phage BCP78]YP_009783431.1 hypothetical protein QLX27_gp058 [Bacillus phage BCU4]AEW47075.1 hypothetical protein BCP78_0068 [Bacillus phage BCP78]AEW47564.1 hypothetical protein BCU4_0058 [Bacillus phage BCU4]AQN32442.1 hypothetical protein BCP12_019 [Bacillus phage BCP12]